ncbi:RIP homotypic interaction motif-containing protein [Streptomyces sp. SID12488]|uniref:RIP homotypic interaction motif-containing protein n=1 Tax=Streptomyces sp. SID12488 TaxID=2706040 RepID=UPI00194421E2|nr:RIP homotypic interaction motif-containing protein [Streptomyces sp. SID12488]
MREGIAVRVIGAVLGVIVVVRLGAWAWSAAGRAWHAFMSALLDALIHVGLAVGVLCTAVVVLFVAGLVVSAFHEALTSRRKRRTSPQRRPVTAEPDAVPQTPSAPATTGPVTPVITGTPIYGPDTSNSSETTPMPDTPVILIIGIPDTPTTLMIAVPASSPTSRGKRATPPTTSFPRDDADVTRGRKVPSPGGSRPPRPVPARPSRTLDNAAAGQQAPAQQVCSTDLEQASPDEPVPPVLMLENCRGIQIGDRTKKYVLYEYRVQAPAPQLATLLRRADIREDLVRLWLSPGDDARRAAVVNKLCQGRPYHLVPRAALDLGSARRPGSAHTSRPSSPDVRLRTVQSPDGPVVIRRSEGVQIGDRTRQDCHFVYQCKGPRMDTRELFAASPSTASALVDALISRSKSVDTEPFQAAFTDALRDCPVSSSERGTVTRTPSTTVVDGVDGVSYGRKNKMTVDSAIDPVVSARRVHREVVRQQHAVQRYAERQMRSAPPDSRPSVSDTASDLDRTAWRPQHRYESPSERGPDRDFPSAPGMSF